jgi:hypothetical protein
MYSMSSFILSSPFLVMEAEMENITPRFEIEGKGAKLAGCD